jgi:prephenate dehydrogenase
MVGFMLDLRDQLETGEDAEIEELLRRAKERRDTWLESKPNLRPGEAAFEQQPEVERPNLLSFRLPNRRK